MSNTAHVTLHFHSNTAKSAFIKRNSITQPEIIAETPASITIEDTGENFANSPFVFQIS